MSLCIISLAGCSWTFVWLDMFHNVDPTSQSISCPVVELEDAVVRAEPERASLLQGEERLGAGAHPRPGAVHSLLYHPRRQARKLLQVRSTASSVFARDGSKLNVVKVVQSKHTCCSPARTQCSVWVKP